MAPVGHSRLLINYCVTLSVTIHLLFVEHQSYNWTLLTNLVPRVSLLCLQGRETLGTRLLANLNLVISNSALSSAEIKIPWINIPSFLSFFIIPSFLQSISQTQTDRQLVRQTDRQSVRQVDSQSVIRCFVISFFHLSDHSWLRWFVFVHILISHLLMSRSWAISNCRYLKLFPYPLLVWHTLGFFCSIIEHDLSW